VARVAHERGLPPKTTPSLARLGRAPRLVFPFRFAIVSLSGSRAGGLLYPTWSPGQPWWAWEMGLQLLLDHVACGTCLIDPTAAVHGVPHPMIHDWTS
jgi:hypothetical protein